MLDTARQYYKMKTLKEILDSMVLGKFNVFHWHFSDDDSWPMYSKSYPDLTKYSAFSPNEIYTIDMAKEIVQYGNVRGIKVIPEIEGPAHVHSI